MAHIGSLRDVLNLECEKGYTNRAVFGGLEKYLQKQSNLLKQSIPNPQLLTEFEQLNLASSTYNSWGIDKREKWLTEILQWLVKLEDAERNKEKKQVRPLISIHGNPIEPAAKSRKCSRTGRGSLHSPVTTIRGITPVSLKKLSRLNVATVEDLLYFFPHRYVDYSQIKPIAGLEEDKEQTIIGTVWQSRITLLGSRRGTEVILGDATGNVRAIWFNQPYLARGFRTNTKIVLSGIISSFHGQKVFKSPEWEILGNRELLHTARLVPIYPLTRGLYAKQIRRWTKEAIDTYVGDLTDFLPIGIKKHCQLLDLPEAITQIHYPDNYQVAQEAQKRLAFDELFLLQIGVLSRKRDWQESQPGNAFNIDREFTTSFLNRLPFTLTMAQQKVLEEIIADLQKPKAMSRLLQGEVGSGKTIIATLALLLAVANGYQGAFMAPTELLAEQHFHTLCNYLSQYSTPKQNTNNTISYEKVFPQPVTIALLVGNLSNRDKKNLQQNIAHGEVDIIIGTHAIIQEKVKFSKLGLAVIDEQHRFGVMQRQKLRQKGFNPHILVMTATPIPRTMALTLYGDLDISVIDELPPGRQVVKTKLLEPDQREQAYTFIRNRITDEGGQIFIIYPLIEESEAIEAKAATTEYEKLCQEIFPEMKLGLLHGRMPPEEKENVMRRFRDGEFNILVSTSVIEVGIDIPKATVMLIESADRFGLSQLHQFRGRVGRGATQSYCLLITDKKLSPEIKTRLSLIERIHDGFLLAEEDLKLRGPGEVFGTTQSGLPNLKVARLSDFHLMELARHEALLLFQDDPNLKKAEHALLQDKLSQIWCNNTEWS